MHLFVSAGEPSGDLHGANLVEMLRHYEPSIKVVGLGGDKMAAAGVDLHYPLTDLAVMWIGRALIRLPTFLRIARQAEVYFRTQRPDAVIVIVNASSSPLGGGRGCQAFHAVKRGDASQHSNRKG